MNLLLLALVPACFALNPVIGRAMVDVFGPASLSIIRWSLSALLVMGLAVARGESERWRAPHTHVLRVAALGAAGMGFCAYAAFEGTRTSPATNIALIYGCTSAFVAAWEVAAGRQRPAALLLWGIAACLAGVVLIITRGHPEVLGTLSFTPGDLWATAGMLVFVVYTVVLRRTAPLLSPLPQFVVMSVAATAAMLPWSVAELAVSVPVLEGWHMPWMVVLVLATGIGAFLGYNIALERNGPVLTSATLTLTPVYAAALAMLLVGEQLAWYHGVALVLVVTGLLLVNRGQVNATLPHERAPVDRSRTVLPDRRTRQDP
jgi:drug/metabolite transporter (DMT)-like permease